LWGCLLVMRRFWRRRRGLCLERIQCLIPPSHVRWLVHCHLYCWTSDVMTQMTRPQYNRKYHFLQLLFHFFVNF
jgi:hypothetical protein